MAVTPWMDGVIKIIIYPLLPHRVQRNLNTPKPPLKKEVFFMYINLYNVITCSILC